MQEVQAADLGGVARSSAVRVHLRYEERFSHLASFQVCLIAEQAGTRIRQYKALQSDSDV